MRNDELAPKFLQQFRMVFIMLIFSQLAACGVVVYFVMEKGPALDEYEQLYFYIPILISFMMAMGSGFVRRYLLGRSQEKRNLADKVDWYRSSTITSLALLQGAGFVNLVFYYLTGEWVLMALFVGTLALFFRYYPAIGNISRELQLSESEAQELEKRVGT